MYNVAMHFVQQGEKLCKKQCFSLRNTLLSQVRLTRQLPDFASLALAIEFHSTNVVSSSLLCGSSCAMVQARVFLDGFHNNRISSMAIILESETWTQAQVPPLFSCIWLQLVVCVCVVLCVCR
jgi:hypothetical protein